MGRVIVPCRGTPLVDIASRQILLPGAAPDKSPLSVDNTRKTAFFRLRLYSFAFRTRHQNGQN